MPSDSSLLRECGANFLLPPRTGCWNKPHLRGHLSVGSTISDSILLRFEKLPLILPQLPTHNFPLPTAISSTFLLLLRTSSSNLERRTSQGMPCKRIMDPWMIRKNICPALKLATMVFLQCTSYGYQVQLHLTTIQETNSWMKAWKCMPSTLKAKGEKDWKNTSHGFINDFVESSHIFPFHLIRLNPKVNTQPTNRLIIDFEDGHASTSACSLFMSSWSAKWNLRKTYISAEVFSGKKNERCLFWYLSRH